MANAIDPILCLLDSRTREFENTTNRELRGELNKRLCGVLGLMLSSEEMRSPSGWQPNKHA
jgi:hypothetical protein